MQQSDARLRLPLTMPLAHLPDRKVSKQYGSVLKPKACPPAIPTIRPRLHESIPVTVSLALQKDSLNQYYRQEQNEPEFLLVLIGVLQSQIHLLLYPTRRVLASSVLECPYFH